MLVLGGGIAGLSLASELGAHRRVVLIEAEEAIGMHSSGRSATMSHYALGDPLVRALTYASRPFFDSPPGDFSQFPLGTRTKVLVHARQDERSALSDLADAIAPFAAFEQVGPEEMTRICPVLRVGPDHSVAGLVDPAGLRIDPHALLQGHARRLRHSGGTIVTGARAQAVDRHAGLWRVETERAGSFTAPILVNAAGAWADEVAVMAGVAPLGLTPLRRTVIVFDGPEGMDVRGWPFTKTVSDALYFAPESGRLLASPMDEVPSPPCDAQPDEYEMALAAQRVEDRTTMQVDRIEHRWAGLRTFAPDRHPAVGFDCLAEGFFWLAGQGGFGLQTSPAIAKIAASLILETGWPVPGVEPSALAPGRFSGQPA